MKINHRVELRKKRLAEKNMGWNPFAKNYSTMSDYDVGIDYMMKFFEHSGKTAENLNVYVQNLKNVSGDSRITLDIESLGMGIKTSGTSFFSNAISSMSESDVDEAAKTLALTSGGKLPASISAFRFALIGQATATPFTDAVLDSTIVKLATSVGDTLLSTAESVVGSVGFLATVNKYLPFILPVGLGFVAYKFYTSNVGSAFVKKKLGV